MRNSKESTLDIPYASLISYNGGYLYIYEAGTRPINDLETGVLRGWDAIRNTKEFKEREKIDLLTDGSSTFYTQKQYFSKSKCPYLFDTSKLVKIRNKDNTYTHLVRDNKVKGELILKYQVIFK